MRTFSAWIGYSLILIGPSACFGQSFAASGLAAPAISAPAAQADLAAAGSILAFRHGGHAGGSGMTGPGPGLGFGGANGGFGLAPGLGGGRGGFAIGSGFGGGYGGYGFYGGGYSSFGAPFVAVPGFPPIVPNAVATPLGGGGFGGLMLPMPRTRSTTSNAGTNTARRPNPARAKEYLEVGDRTFRAGNIHRAEERYQLAAKADPTSPLPRVHLAQVSLVRADYSAAAEHLRAAVTVSQGSAWLVNAPDIQSMFSEPGDYARQIGKLESHLQAHPTDRDAWFLLGAEHYFSGRTQAAADAFERLTDRKPDEALAAFLEVAKP